MSGKSVGLCIRRSGAQDRTTGIRVVVASSFLGRFVGLLAHKTLGIDSGLLLVPCGSIHTLGMRFPIDVIFLDQSGKVLGWADNVSPNRLRFAPRHTQQVLEIADGNRIRTGINLDDHLIFG